MGFAIVSNDPQKGVLGFSLSGNLGPHDTIDNPGLKITLDCLEHYASEPTRVDSIDYYEYGDWTSTYYVPITGYCQVKWNQGNKFIKNEFNYFCPDSSIYHCPAGCVPVATAQLMSMYKYPPSYNSYTFDWTAMIASSTATNLYNEYYVGRLLQQLGLYNNLNVSYSPSGSLAYSSNIPRTLEHFGFSDGGTYQYFSNYDIQELIAGYPIIIRGSTNDGSGHAWLGHGLLKRERSVTAYGYHGEVIETNIETFYYVLCNFGWSGSGDGFYSTFIYNTINGPLFQDPTLLYTVNGGYCFDSTIMTVSGIRL